MSYDVNDELAHCRHMLAQTSNALEPYHQEHYLYGQLTPSDLAEFDKLKRQRDLWEQLVNELDAYVTTKAGGSPDDQEQADLFSEAAGA